MRVKLILAGLVILVVAVYAVTSFTGSLTSRVSFTEAESHGKRVQVMGEILHDQVKYDVEGQQLQFPIKDEDDRLMNVNFSGTMPGNFDQATHVVCVGQYDGKTFQADQLLVKCPSKYLGEEK